jgi:hypothetical protein
MAAIEIVEPPAPPLIIIRRIKASLSSRRVIVCRGLDTQALESWPSLNDGKQTATFHVWRFTSRADEVILSATNRESHPPGTTTTHVDHLYKNIHPLC